MCKDYANQTCTCIGRGRAVKPYYNDSIKTKTIILLYRVSCFVMITVLYMTACARVNDSVCIIGCVDDRRFCMYCVSIVSARGMS